MAPGADGSAKISEERLCEIAGVNRTTRRTWASRHLLSRKSDGYGEWDAVELAVLDWLTSRLGPSDGPLAWTQIRETLPTERDSAELDLVFDSQHKGVLLTSDLGRAASLLRHGRPVRIISLMPVIVEIRQAFRRLTMLSE